MAGKVKLPGEIEAVQFRGDLESFLLISEWVYGKGGRSAYFPERNGMSFMYRLRLFDVRMWDYVMYTEGDFKLMSRHDFEIAYEETP
jgi:hypothetical protein